MLRNHLRLGILAFAVVVASACGGSPTATRATKPLDIQATPDATPTAEASSPSELTTVEPTAPSVPSVPATTYRDEVAGFEFDHPADWSVGPVEQHSRGGITAFTSWERPTDVLPNATPPGETRMDATVQLWEPTGDLEAFLNQRKGAWDASGIKVVSDEAWTLADGRPARAFVVAGSDGAQAFFFFTTLGEKYLVLSGDGDLDLLAEIAHTVRPIPSGY